MRSKFLVLTAAAAALAGGLTLPAATAASAEDRLSQAATITPAGATYYVLYNSPVFKVPAYPAPEVGTVRANTYVAGFETARDITGRSYTRISYESPEGVKIEGWVWSSSLEQ